MAPRSPAPARASRRLGYVMTDHPRPSQTFVMQEIQQLRAHGWEVVPFSLNAPDAGGLDAAAAEEAARTFYVKQAGPGRIALAVLAVSVRHPAGVLRFLRGAFRGIGFDARAALWRVFHCGMAVLVWRECRRRDLAHLHAQFGGPSATLAWLTASLAHELGARTPTWSYVVHGYHEFTDERRNQLDRKTREAAFTVCISDHQRSQLLRIAGPEVAPRVHVVRVGIDFATFARRDPTPRHEPARVLTVARLDAEKGLFVLLDALAALRARGRTVALDLVGDGPLRDELVARADALGLAEQVQVLGARPPAEVAARLREADVFCLPSFAEGIPVSIMEAMAIGVPVITTYVNGIPELARDRQTALVVPAGNVDALTDALATMLDDDALRASMVEAAAARVREAHDLHASTAQLMALFDDVLVPGEG